MQSISFTESKLLITQTEFRPKNLKKFILTNKGLDTNFRIVEEVSKITIPFVCIINCFTSLLVLIMLTRFKLTELVSVHFESSTNCSLHLNMQDLIKMMFVLLTINIFFYCSKIVTMFIVWTKVFGLHFNCYPKKTLSIYTNITFHLLQILNGLIYLFELKTIHGDI